MENWLGSPGTLSVSPMGRTFDLVTSHRRDVGDDGLFLRRDAGGDLADQSVSPSGQGSVFLGYRSEQVKQFVRFVQAQYGQPLHGVRERCEVHVVDCCVAVHGLGNGLRGRLVTRLVWFVRGPVSLNVVQPATRLPG